MTQDEIIRMARDAGIPIETDWAGRPSTLVINDSGVSLRGVDDLERFAALVAAYEREACAKVADGELMNTNMQTSYPPKSSAAWNIAAAIRARGEK